VLKFLTEDEIAAVVKPLTLNRRRALHCSRREQTVFASLGALRLKLAEKLDLIPKETYNLLWVTEFPLLEWDEEEQRISAMHHLSPPDGRGFGESGHRSGNVRAKAYDIVLNAWKSAAARSVFTRRSCKSRCSAASVLRTSKRSIASLLMTPSASARRRTADGYGLVRLAKLITVRRAFADVIAFPKVQNASCR
jgi:aspartyl-tRNA synthetase